MPVRYSYGITIDLSDRVIEGMVDEEYRLFAFSGLAEQQLYIPFDDAEECLRTMLDWVRKELERVGSDPSGERVDRYVEQQEGK